MLSVARFVLNLYALSRDDRRTEAIDYALDFFDQRLIEGNVAECEKALSLLRPDHLASSVVVSILGITRKANDLAARRGFFDLALEEISRVKGRRYATELLNRYR